MKFRFIRQHADQGGVDALCRTMGVTRGGYWSWLRRKPSARDDANSVLLTQLHKAHRGMRRVYGSPRMHRHLVSLGVRCSKTRIEKLMRDNGILAKQGKKFKPTTTDSNHSLPIAENILNRRFTWPAPNQAWVADITYIPTKQGWLYLATVMDLFSRRIIGWAMGDRVDRHLTIRALRMAVQRRRPPKGLIHHSDRGSQYASRDYQTELENHTMVCSMSRKGNCWDNAPMESWYRTLKVELFEDDAFATRKQATAAIFEYMEVFYDRQRIHTTIGGRTPAEFEEQFRRKEA